MNEEKTYKANEVMSMLEQLNDGIRIIGEQHGETTSRLDGIDSRLEIMQDDITEIKHKLSEKVDRDEFNKLENRVVKMEKLILAKSA
ncbi:MAG: hypothetical protein COZ85_02250 [Candidatus Moranbacteria bacterium CG_4_8_14_3_um_filter_34_16]|nr:MAG: hypothetical protein COT31_00280 [Candidatus Moranbacteria bacterium CG08_land_8_20_14_0_20_34_16]PIW94990.1 MAG: hypothetical protein COZ85_02250 [Candidatus Moranbacteria bacterium CG_4_8_14_3_um_filter_34_16]